MKPNVKSTLSSLLLLLLLFEATLAFATLNTTVNYSCQNAGSGTDCQLPPEGVHATINDGTQVSVGDAFGNASGQASYGLLNSSASGSWIPDAPLPTYASAGNSTTNFQDNLTFTGGTGNVTVTVTMKIDSSVISAISFSNGHTWVNSSISILGSSYGWYVLNNIYDSSYQNVGQIQIVCQSTNCQWVSSDGTFTSGNNFIDHSPASSGLLVATFNVPYDTPLQFLVQLSTQGLHSASISSSGRITIAMPPGTSITSASGTTYNQATTTENATVPLPTWCILALGIALVGIRKVTKFKSD